MTPPAYNKTCLNCNTPFETIYDFKKYCKRFCKETAKRRRQGVKELGIDWPQTYERECPNCEESFSTTLKSQTYCDSSCRAYAKELRLRRTANRLETNARHRYRHKVYIRDKGICQICFDLVHLSTQYPDPKSPSLDHIIPVSKGGTNALKNLRITHWICNVNRGNRTEQIQDF